jgi:hypothetical protein
MADRLPFDPLDPQRDAVYAAELAVFPEDARQQLPLADLQRLSDELHASPWFVRMFPKAKRQTIKDGRGSKWSRSNLDNTIHLLKKSRVPDVLYHEEIHRVIPPGAEWHGAVFCGMLLYFVGKIYGQTTKDKLRREFKKQKPPVVWDRRVARFGDLRRNGEERE